ncbi:MAG: 5-oxoprolinase subunit PxpB [Acetobacteraceae bacterium]|nr:5-oxoprolinase subunit PxpB [Acetobacteraceae bacterium]
MNAIPGVPVPHGAFATRRVSRYRPKFGPVANDADPASRPAHRAGRAAPRFLPVGDTGISVEFGTEIDPALNDAVTSLDHAIAGAELLGVVETVPSFRSLLVIFEPALVDRASLLAELRVLAGRATRGKHLPGRRWTLPVVYAPPFGEDLAEVASLLGMAERQVIAAHTEAEFRVYMLGFQPGLPNLGGLPPALHVSRRTTPRAPVPGGSVMIGGVQGAIMPLSTPSGFYLLGRTPVRLFDRRRPEPALLRAGDAVRFREVCADEYDALREMVAAGNIDAGAALEIADAA